VILGTRKKCKRKESIPNLKKGDQVISDDESKANDFNEFFMAYLPTKTLTFRIAIRLR
jgi:hypothetical protein